MTNLRFIPLTAYLFTAYLFTSYTSFSQPPACPAITTSCCAAIGSGSTFIMTPDPNNITITFDSFGEYLAANAQYGATTLRLTVGTGPGLPCVNGCRWKLHVNVDNNGAPAAQWEQLAVYGSGSGTIPTINLLDFKIRNTCNTSETGTGFVDIASSGNFRCIIDNNCLSGTAPDNGPHANQDAGDCITNVNDNGSYLTNPGEYTFIIDYQITPTLTMAAGLYRITIRYCLSDGD
ncbi:MAG: hypothetical protein V1781_06250 [Bacteroidota bacterium]